MKKYILWAICGTAMFSLQAQDTIQVPIYRMGNADTINTVDAAAGIHNIDQPSRAAESAADKSATLRKRQRLTAFTSIGIYGGALLALNQAWYSNYPRSSFHTFNDNSEWLQTDKVGHAWSTYQLARLSYNAWKWSGKSEKSAILLGAISGPGFLTVIETLDGFSSQWGWSWGDMAANLFGGGLFAGQQLAWKEQRVDYKFSVHRIDYGNSRLINRANQLFGKSLPERFLKDYNAQTYWLSANLSAFMKQSRIPTWLNIAFGYGANGMFGANQNLALDETGAVSFDRRDIARSRQFYLAPDIKWSRIRTNKKWLKTVFFVLDGIKFPLPGLELSRGKLELRGILF